MNKFLGIITTIGILLAFVLIRINPALSHELAIGAFIVFIGWSALHDEEVNRR